MRLATLRNGTPDGAPAAVVDGRAVLLQELGFDGSLLQLIQAGPDELERVRRALSRATPGKTLESANYAAPLPHPRKIVAIGLNYLEHATESKMDLPKTPLVFAKFPSSVTGPTDPIQVPAELTHQVDYEAELGVVIGRTAKTVSQDDALDYVFGYTIMNDVSARDLQFSDGQWVRAKSLDTFCPMGPVIVTRDEIPDPQRLTLGCAVNGEMRQEQSTRDMIFGVAYLVSFLSYSFTLEPGDAIASGTPQGVAFGRESPEYLKPGDKVRTWVDGIGELMNEVVSA